MQPESSARVQVGAPRLARFAGEPDLRRRRSFWREFTGDRAAVAGLAVVLCFAVAALGAPLLATHDPLAVDPANALQSPSAEHLLGTDNLGRDTFSRLLYGSRLSLGTAALAAVVVMTAGVALGLLSGLAGGWIDGLFMRVVDGLLAFPHLILALAIAGTLSSGVLGIIIGLTAVSWASYARLVRGLVLQARERPFVQAARAVGASGFRIAVRHLVPNIIPPVIVLLTIEMGSLILAVSALSFLGIGAQPPTPEWGTMLNDGRRFLFTDADLMIFPGSAIFLVVLGFNLLGDGLRDVLDPKELGERR